MEVSDERKDSVKAETKGFIKKFKGIKNLQIIVVIFIIAVALIIYSTVTAAKSADSTQTVGSVMTSDEQRLSAILSNIDGAGKVEAMITSADGTITGVLVIADGADDITVRLRLLEATATALGVSRNVVNVYSRK